MGNVDTRSLAREFIFKFLYHLQMADSSEKIKAMANDHNLLEEEIKTYITSLEEKDSDIPSNFKSIKLKKITPDIISILENYPNILETIKANIQSWNISKLKKIDLTILIVATFELTIRKVSKKIVIDEAIKLAKRFSDSQSYSFVNAVLDSISVNNA
ncbi:MAG: transcription antitermination factor NusB [Bdellovibrionales bacterium RIFOXYD12_FULL_39_22]|nr:MAG: transcription antitermination factor NusB [Bdellovibrionales bacterium RIFOXYB1_FULL_39_21]OFZ43000.1 MAG: transcription antitermination factor NusB [Bdellovibrionales bacterium RIFOXYC12_FULL_39_17]OFZ50914.1 MAG: transcription antitermination factor NusB [Bdellovibrionales bacterium RIFOXYC1_FULL_39_130]OFZ72965.1 MAG: transcription antitermination factor NusB [Bdellovibrionales bacterium RIFOXYC2_FULL_39_8]OFZ78137.1 MAG: transcription antitermination factor NusB [Bdellovibrionales b